MTAGPAAECGAEKKDSKRREDVLGGHLHVTVPQGSNRWQPPSYRDAVWTEPDHCRPSRWIALKGRLTPPARDAMERQILVYGWHERGRDKRRKTCFREPELLKGPFIRLGGVDAVSEMEGPADRTSDNG